MSDDLLDPSEIDALLGQAGGGAPNPSAGGGGSPAAGAGGQASDREILSQSDLDSLFQQANAGGGVPVPAAAKQASAPAAENRSSASTETLLNQMESDLASVLAGESNRMKPPPAVFGSPSPFELPAFSSRDSGSESGSLGVLEEVDLDLRIELGRTELLIEEVLKLREGAVVPLDKLAGDPVDVIVNGRLVARGEVLVLNDNFCVRIAEILSPTL